MVGNISYSNQYFRVFRGSKGGCLCVLRAQLYGLGYPRQPSPRGNFIERLYMKTWLIIIINPYLYTISEGVLLTLTVKSLFIWDN